MASAPVKRGNGQIPEAFFDFSGCIRFGFAAVWIRKFFLGFGDVFDPLAAQRFFIFADDDDVGHIITDRCTGAEQQASLRFIF